MKKILLFLLLGSFALITNAQINPNYKKDSIYINEINLLNTELNNLKTTNNIAIGYYDQAQTSNLLGVFFFGMSSAIVAMAATNDVRATFPYILTGFSCSVSLAFFVDGQIQMNRCFKQLGFRYKCRCKKKK